MRHRAASVALTGVLALGGLSACGEAEQDEVEQQVEDGAGQVQEGAEDAGNEAEELVEEGAEESDEG